MYLLPITYTDMDWKILRQIWSEIYLFLKMKTFRLTLRYTWQNKIIVIRYCWLLTTVWFLFCNSENLNGEGPTIISMQYKMYTFFYKSQDSQIINQVSGNASNLSKFIYSVISDTSFSLFFEKIVNSNRIPYQLRSVKMHILK